MNYPIWDLFATGGGFWIAFVATVVHVFVSHFAVGGGLWLVLTERRGPEVQERQEPATPTSRATASSSCC